MWIKVCSRPGNVQYEELCRMSSHRLNPYFYNRIIGRVLAIPTKRGDLDFYFQEKEWKALMKALGQPVIDDDSSFAKMQKLYQKIAKIYYRSSNNVSTLSLKKYPSRQLLKVYEKFKRGTLAVHYFFYFPWAVNDWVDPFFRQEVQKQLLDKSNFIIEAISRPIRQIRFNTQLSELLNIKKQKKLLERDFIKHAAKWGYLKLYTPHDSFYQAKDFKDMISGLNAQKEIAKMEEHLKKAKDDFQKALAILSPYPKLLNLAKLINWCVWLKTERIDLYKEVTGNIKPFFAELDRRLGLKDFQSSFLTINEIENFLSRGVTPDLSEIKKRTKIRYAAYFNRDRFIVYTDEKDIKKLIQKELPILKTTKLRGITAQAGSAVRGKVRIISTAVEVKKFQKGEILVASMTRPDFILAMRKAKAMVTDEGGITCHAAIVSRELGIPCIIGTKIATKILQDGDYVEVDANLGVVKKLKDAKRSVVRRKTH